MCHPAGEQHMPAQIRKNALRVVLRIFLATSLRTELVDAGLGFRTRELAVGDHEIPIKHDFLDKLLLARRERHLGFEIGNAVQWGMRRPHKEAEHVFNPAIAHEEIEGSGPTLLSRLGFNSSRARHRSTTPMAMDGP